MKKLKLSLQNIEGVEVLTRAQLKNVLGGTNLPETTESPKGCKGITLCDPELGCADEDGNKCECKKYSTGNYCV